MSREKARRKYTRDFKAQAVERCRQPGMTVIRVAGDLGIAPNALYRWKKELAESGADAFRGHGKRTAADAAK
ncbi:MAG: transposase [Phycisphaerae bacterium]|nr:transposase [Phycisphaerae bacterium]